MPILGILIKNKYNLRSKKIKKEKNVKFKKENCKNKVFTEFIDVKKDKFKGGDRRLTNYLVRSCSPNRYNCHLSKLIQNGPHYFPSWTEIGLNEERERHHKCKKFVNYSKKKAKKNIFEILKKNLEFSYEINKYSNDPMEID